MILINAKSSYWPTLMLSFRWLVRRSNIFQFSVLCAISFFFVHFSFSFSFVKLNLRFLIFSIFPYTFRRFAIDPINIKPTSECSVFHNLRPMIDDNTNSIKYKNCWYRVCKCRQIIYIVIRWIILYIYWSVFHCAQQLQYRWRKNWTERCKRIEKETGKKHTAKLTRTRSQAETMINSPHLISIEIHNQLQLFIFVEDSKSCRTLSLVLQQSIASEFRSLSLLFYIIHLFSFDLSYNLNF